MREDEELRSGECNKELAAARKDHDSAGEEGKLCSLLMRFVVYRTPYSQA